MWFKNLSCYRLPENWPMTAAQLAELLAPQAFKPCASNEITSIGWSAPRPDGDLVHTVNRQMLLMLTVEKKLLPTSYVNAVAKAKAAELEEKQGFAPGRKAMKELKEQAADELLPRAFPIARHTMVWIDPVAGWLVVDSASAGASDDVLKLLLKAIPKFPVESVRVARSPVEVMTAWLETDEAPVGFTVDQDAIMQSTGESRASVSYKKHALDVADIRRHIAAGKQCTRLAMTWNDKISFVLTESLTIKSVAPLDMIMENDRSTRNDDERFDNDMMLMTGELAKMLADIMEALGGEVGDLVSPARQPAAALPDDPNVVDEADQYDAAVAVVVKNRRVSISLVQRHLRIGYNQAARLIELMEKNDVVGPIMSNGERTIFLTEVAA